MVDDRCRMKSVSSMYMLLSSCSGTLRTRMKTCFCGHHSNYFIDVQPQKSLLLVGIGLVVFDVSTTTL